MVESDEEQIEVLKNWWDENGTSLIVTLVLVLGGTFGYRAWENSVVETGEAASAVYEDLVTAVSSLTGSDDESMRQTAQSLTNTLKSDHGSSAYAVFAAMQMAKIGVENGDLDGAQAELEWALDNVDEPHIEAVIRNRLARVLIAKGNPTAAISRLINYKPVASQLASYEEVMGDAYFKLGDMQNARQAYKRAVEHLGDIEKPVLELKLADIPLASGGVPATEAATEETDMSPEVEQADEEEDA